MKKIIDRTSFETAPDPEKTAQYWIDKLHTFDPHANRYILLLKTVIIDPDNINMLNELDDYLTKNVLSTEKAKNVNKIKKHGSEYLWLRVLKQMMFIRSKLFAFIKHNPNKKMNLNNKKAIERISVAIKNYVAKSIDMEVSNNEELVSLSLTSKLKKFQDPKTGIMPDL